MQQLRKLRHGQVKLFVVVTQLVRTEAGLKPRQFDSRASDYNYCILVLQALFGHKAALWIAN